MLTFADEPDRESHSREYGGKADLKVAIAEPRVGSVVPAPCDGFHSSPGQGARTVTRA